MFMRSSISIILNFIIGVFYNACYNTILHSSITYCAMYVCNFLGGLYPLGPLKICCSYLLLSCSNAVRLWNSHFILLLDVSMATSLYGCCFLPAQTSLILSLHNHLYKLPLNTGIVCLCVCVCAYVCVHMCVCACVCVFMCVIV